MLLLHAAGFSISNQVHDSVWLNVDNEKEVTEAQDIMENWTHETFGLTFRTDRKMLHGKNVRDDQNKRFSFSAQYEQDDLMTTPFENLQKGDQRDMRRGTTTSTFLL